MRSSLFTILTSLCYLTLALPAQNVIACLDFIGYVGLQGFTNPDGSYTALNYTVTASLRSATDPSDPATLQEVCHYNNVYQYAMIGTELTCVTGYTGRFLWGMTEVSYTTPTIPSFIGTDPAFSLNETAKEGGSGMVYSGRFGCDGLNDTVTAWYNWGGFRERA